MIKELGSSKDLKNHIKNIQEKYPYNSAITLQILDPEEYLSALDDTLLSIILAYTGTTKETSRFQHTIPIIESIYKLADVNFIGIWSFLQNSVVISCTKNEQV
jgi:hypothetical protein